VELTTKEYKTLVLKRYLKNNIIFFVCGPNSKSKDWLTIEQIIKKYNYTHYRISTKFSIKTLKYSTLFNIQAITSSNTFFMEPNNKMELKTTIFNVIKQFFFFILSVKLNNKIYSIGQINNTNSFHYVNNKLIFYQFNIAHIKLIYNFNTIQKLNSE
jgi:hypothetical protein